jgi:hypothetical protein
MRGVKTMIKISRIEIKNFLGIEEIQLSLGDINTFSGGNGQGKTSILDSIQKAIYNSETPRPKVVRSGAEESQLFVEFDNGITVERTINAEGAKVKVIDNGVPVRAPEAFLKKLLGQYTFGFNPVSFIQKSDKEQAEILLSLLPIEVSQEDLQEWFVDPELYPDGLIPPVNCNKHGLEVCKDLAAKNTGWLYDKRAVVNKESELLKNEIISLENQLPDNYDSNQWINVTLRDKQQTISEAMKVNSYIEQANQLISSTDSKVDAIKARYASRISELHKEKAESITRFERNQQYKTSDILEKILELEKEIVKLKSELENIDSETDAYIKAIHQTTHEKIQLNKDFELKEIDEVKEKCKNAQKYIDSNKFIDIEPLQAAFDEAEKMRSFLPIAEKLDDLRVKFGQKEYEASVLDRFVQIARSKPSELLAKVSLPVPGLGIEDGNITINGLPIKNLSTSEQLRVALDIARTTAGALKLICVDRFESMDADVQQEFYRQIEGDGYQYFITTVTSGTLKVDVK